MPGRHVMEENMKRAMLVALISVFTIGAAWAQETCESKAVDKSGQPLSGAAKTSFLQKCKRDACESKAIDKNGKKLSGAAKNSFLTKCEKAA
jgi:hypothetical protein